MKYFYESYYPGLFYIFLKYQSTSMAYPGLSWMEMNTLMQKSGVLNSEFSEKNCDKIYKLVVQKMVTVLNKETIEGKELKKYLFRGGFVSYLARIALERYYYGKKIWLKIGQKNGNITPEKAIDMFMDRFLDAAENCRDVYEVKRVNDI